MYKSFIAFVFFVIITNILYAENFKFVEATIDGIHAALGSGKMTCRQVVSGYLDRILTYDQDKKLNAISFINQKALEKADDIDEKIKLGKE